MNIKKIRYYLELVALPAFAYLVVHMAGHGFMLLAEGHETHGHEEAHGFIADIFNTEVLTGVVLFLIFTWVWHRPNFKKLVPCSHDHCHHKGKTAHYLAIVALCLHFFPEAAVRQALLSDFDQGGKLAFIGVIAFAAHFLVDVIIVAMISSYWKGHKFGLVFVTIASTWILAFVLGEQASHLIPESAEGILYIISAFLLAMFVHKPHKPVHSCNTC